MEKLRINLSLFFIFLIIVFFSGCASTNNTSSKSQKKSPEIVDDGYQQVLAKDTNQANFEVKPNEERKSNVTLEDMIRRLPGVQVSGSGQNLSVKVSGSESFMSGTSPLYVVNGTSIGNSYSQVVNMLNPNDITSIRVLKGSDASIYGTRGANGVILIRTK